MSSGLSFHVEIFLGVSDCAGESAVFTGFWFDIHWIPLKSIKDFTRIPLWISLQFRILSEIQQISSEIHHAFQEKSVTDIGEIYRISRISLFATE